MGISENARVILEKRYLKKDDTGKPLESVDGMFERVASAIAAADIIYDPQTDIDAVQKSFYSLMTNLDFLPNSPTLMNAGRPLGQLSACFVLPVDDSMEAIFEAIKQAALIHKSGGGTGFSFSRLRPLGSTVNSTGGVASGPISFMKVFNVATESVKQGGTRRGANMGILRIDHPDILQFIDCKQDGKEITNFNISVAITEDFMDAVEKDEPYDLIDPKTDSSVGQLSAREVFDKIVLSAWRNGEPGIVFIDRLNRDNVVPSKGQIESTNPCGEQPLLPYESCNLGSINLVNMLKKSDSGYSMDYEKLKSTVFEAVHFLDNVIDVNKYPLELIDKTTKETRKIGLGIMGWADMLLHLKIPYSSEEAVALADKIMGFISECAWAKSTELAKTRGAFPLFEVSTLKDRAPVRNATVTTIAPTGTLSIIAGVSSGIEPVFAYAYIRNVMDNTELLEVNPILKEELVSRGIYNEELMRRISQEGTLAHIAELPEDLRQVYLAAHDISPEWHIKMQAAFQRHVDNAVSKTVNFPKDATPDEVRDVYQLAFRLGCKGVTIYRDGSRESQVLNIGKVNASKAEETETEKIKEVAEKCVPSGSADQKITPRPRPEITNGLTERVKIGCGNLYITVNYDERGICEVFTNTGRHGGCPSQSEATSRLISIALRSGLDVDTIIKQLKGIRCPSTIRQPGMKVTSCPDAIAQMIQKVAHYQNGGGHSVSFDSQPDTTQTGEPGIPAPGTQYCPECNGIIEHEGGCVICRNCGYSKCG